MDVTTSGTLSSTDSNLSLSVTLKNTNISIGGTATQVSSLTIPVAVRGSINNPVFSVDSSVLQKGLLNAGKDKTVRRLEEEAPKKLGLDTEKEGGNLMDKAKGIFGGFLKKKKKPKPEEEPP
jgi:hypothetical protein